MILRGPDNTPETTERRVHGGKGVVRMRALFEGEFESDLMYLHDCVMEPGSVIGMHRHKNSEELYYVIRGTARVNVDGQSFDLKAGDAFLTFKGSAHEFVNAEENGECHVLVIPARVRDAAPR